VAQKDPRTAGQELATTIDNLKKQLDMLDQRLDNIDSVVSAVVERVMSQPVTMSLTCPHCGKSTDINMVGNSKPGAARQ